MDYNTLILFWSVVLVFAILVYGVLDGFDLGVGMLFGLSRTEKDRDALVAAIAPTWDGNETWLILIGTILFGAFSQVYSVLLSALYIPILLMMVGLIFRGVAFEFRHSASAEMRRYWDIGFWAGSGVVSFVQGAALGAMIGGIPVVDRQFAGGAFDWLRPFPILCGVGLMAGYVLLGACALIARGEDSLRERALIWGRRSTMGMVVILGLATVLTFWLQPDAWSRLVDRYWALPLPIIWGAIIVTLINVLHTDQRSRLPFLLATLSFVTAFLFYLAVFWPWVIPGSVTLEAAAAPESSLRFLFWGAGLFGLPIIVTYTVVIYQVFRVHPVSTKPEVPGIRHYEHAAGGWGALLGTARAIRDQMDTPEVLVTLLETNKPNGFDCPGCAWGDKNHTSTFQFCENGAKAVSWETTTKRATPEFFAAHTVNELLGWSDYALEDVGRLTHPLKYDAATDKYQQVAWDVAFADIGNALRRMPDPNAVEFYTSGRASNEASFLYQVFAREYGSGNFPDCSNMCQEPTSVGLPQSIGIGKGTVSLDDFDRCEMIISIGHNPATNHPRMMGTLWEASGRGVPIVVLNPLRERGLERFIDPQDPVEMVTGDYRRIASTYLQVKAGGDVAALKGIMKALLALDDAGMAGALDHDFIQQHTQGFEAVADDVRTTAWPDIERGAGLSRQDLERVAELYARSNATIVTYGLGFTQHNTGTANVHQVVNLLLMRGNFGKPGAGICPLRGHSNVQGNRSVGITEKPYPALLDGIERTFGFRPSAAHGHDAVAAMHAIIEGRAKALISLGGSYSVAMPDPDRCFPAMRRLDLTVFVATKPNRSHLLAGKASYILPCLGRTERDVQKTGYQFITVEDSMSMVHSSTGRMLPASPELRSEAAIVAGIAKAALPNSRVPWDDMIADYDRIRAAIASVFPDFGDFNARIRVPGGFRLPLPPTERIWNTPSGRAQFMVFKGISEDGMDVPGTLRLSTIRSHGQYNTTIYNLDDRYRSVFGRRDVVFMNKDDMAEFGIGHGDRVDLETAISGATASRLNGLTAVEHDISRGSVAAYYPEANVLIPLGWGDKQSGIPAYKSVPVRVLRAGA